TQRELIDSELARLAGLARALDRAIATIEHGKEQTEETMFDGFHPSQYEDEAHERWGDTDAHKESARRAMSYREEQWREMHSAIGEMYVADPRFAAHYEKVEPGLTAYVRDAIVANASGADAHA
ncbi:MAG: TipAS antibiotic-recognition domain-containing protein, partial [Solirubrobacteraceae bacterium]